MPNESITEAVGHLNRALSELIDNPTEENRAHSNDLLEALVRPVAVFNGDTTGPGIAMRPVMHNALPMVGSYELVTLDNET